MITCSGRGAVAWSGGGPFKFEVTPVYYCLNLDKLSSNDTFYTSRIYCLRNYVSNYIKNAPFLYKWAAFIDVVEYKCWALDP